MKLDSKNLKIFVGKIKLKNCLQSNLEMSKLTPITIKYGNKLKLIDLISKINAKLVYYSFNCYYNIYIYMDIKNINVYEVNIKSPSICSVLNNFFVLSGVQKRVFSLIILYFLSIIKLLDINLERVYLKSYCRSVQASFFSKKIELVY